MKTRIISIISGNFSGGIVLVLMNMLNRSMYPLPPDATINNRPVLEAYLSSMPDGAFLLSFAGMALAGFTGGFVAAITDRVNSRRNAILVAALFTIFGITGLMMVSHPVRLWIIAIITYIPLALLGHKAARLIKQA